MQLRQLIAQRMRLFAFAYAHHGVMRRLHLIVRHHDHPNIWLTFLDGAHGVTFLVQQVGGDRNRYDGMDFARILLQRLFFDQTQDGECQRFVVTHGTGTVTARADVMTGLAQ